MVGWVVDRMTAWYHGKRCLRIRRERLDDIDEVCSSGLSAALSAVEHQSLLSGIPHSVQQFGGATAEWSARHGELAIRVRHTTCSDATCQCGVVVVVAVDVLAVGAVTVAVARRAD